MLRSDELPQEPMEDFMGGALRSVVKQLREQVSIDQRAHEPVCHVLLGTLRPGETGRAETDIALLPTGPGNYTLKVRILAREIATPILKEQVIAIEGEARQMGLEELMPLLCGDPAQ